MQHPTAFEHPWLSRESRGDDLLLHLLEDRERLIARAADEGGSYNVTPETKAKIGTILGEIASRQSELGIDPAAFSPPYNPVELEAERAIVQHNTHRLPE